MTRYRWLLLVALLVAAAAALLAFTRIGDPVRTLLTRRTTEPDSGAGGADTSSSVAPGAPASGIPRGDVVIDPRRQQLIGIRTEPVTRGPLAQSVRAVGLVRPDETRQAEINTKVDGWIRDLYADYTGKAIRSGERLFTLYSPALLTTESEYLLARRGHSQAEHAEVGSVREYSERLLKAAQDRLLLWDLTTDDIRAIEDRGEATGIVTFRSPIDGVIVEKTAIKGMRVMAGQTLFRLADLSTVWVEADVYERDVASVRVGQAATVRLDAYPGEPFSGRTTYLYPIVDEATRTARVRVQLPNRNGRLKPGMYATVELQSSTESGLSIPANALLDSGTEQLVFVPEGNGYFRPRRVKAGRRVGDRVEIADGLTEGEMVATSATFFLDSESQLRAGLQNYEPSAPAPGPSAAPASALDIAFRALVDPPKTGENPFEVVLKDSTGNPVTDADVSVRFFMPAMPTMNMPAMQNSAALLHSGNGTYRGTGQVLMGGNWEVTVTATRAGKEIGSRKLSMIAR
jgi:multidrug efflux pump subunit AcrA (membrane-fusion protein)